MTLYLIYLKDVKKGDNSLYAFTTLKDIKDQFLQERNSDLFDVRKMEGDEEDIALRGIISTYSQYKLVEEIVFDGNTNFKVYMTVNESQFFAESCEEIRNNLLEYSKVLLAISFKTKILNAIRSVIDIYLESEKKDNLMPINTFKVYYYLFKNTFYQNKEE